MHDDNWHLRTPEATGRVVDTAAYEAARHGRTWEDTRARYKAAAIDVTATDGTVLSVPAENAWDLASHIVEVANNLAERDLQPTERRTFTGPCPPFCQVNHRASAVEWPHDLHSSLARAFLPLSLCRFPHNDEPDELSIEIVQPVDGSLPPHLQVWAERFDDALKVTEDEAVALVAALVERIAELQQIKQAAEAPTPRVPVAA